VEVVASLFQGRTAAAQCGLFTYKSVPVIFEPPFTYVNFVLIGNFVLIRMTLTLTLTLLPLLNTSLRVSSLPHLRIKVCWRMFTTYTERWC